MATYVLIHGAGDVGWYWHLVETELRKSGHDVVAMDLPVEDDSAGLPEYADVVVRGHPMSAGVRSRNAGSFSALVTIVLVAPMFAVLLRT